MRLIRIFHIQDASYRTTQSMLAAKSEIVHKPMPPSQRAREEVAIKQTVRIASALAQEHVHNSIVQIQSAQWQIVQETVTIWTAVIANIATSDIVTPIRHWTVKSVTTMEIWWMLSATMVNALEHPLGVSRIQASSNVRVARCATWTRNSVLQIRPRREILASMAMAGREPARMAYVRPRSRSSIKLS